LTKLRNFYPLFKFMTAIVIFRHPSV